MSNLGLVLTPYGKVPNSYPWEIAQSSIGFKTYLCPYDPQYYTRGEAGFYHDTPMGYFGSSGVKKLTDRIKSFFKISKRGALGAIPTDAEMARAYSWYTPVQSGWIYAVDPKRYIPPPWVPPYNESRIGRFGPQPSYADGGTAKFLGDATTDTLNPSTNILTPSTADDVIRALNKHYEKQFMISALGTGVGIIASAVLIFRTVKGIQEDTKERDRKESISSK